MKITIKLMICTLFFGLQLSMAQAKEVTLPFNGLTLNANLEIAEDKKITDGVVLIMHSFWRIMAWKLSRRARRLF